MRVAAFPESGGASPGQGRPSSPVQAGLAAPLKRPSLLSFGQQVVCDACWDGRVDENDSGAVGTTVTLTCDLGKGALSVSSVSTEVKAADGSFEFGRVPTVMKYSKFKGCTLEIPNSQSSKWGTMDRSVSSIHVLTPSGSKVLHSRAIYTVPTLRLKSEAKASHCHGEHVVRCNESSVPVRFQGRKDGDFCILSDSNLHINSHLIGKTGENGSDNTWVQALGILFGDKHLYIGAQQVATWDASADHLLFVLDGEVPLAVSNTVDDSIYTSKDGRVTVIRYNKANTAEIEIENLMTLTVEARPSHQDSWTVDSCFVHLDLRIHFAQLSGSAMGVLGQSYHQAWMPPNRPRGAVQSTYTLDDIASYTSSSLFATDCPASSFEGLPVEAIEASATAHRLALLAEDDDADYEEIFATSCSSDKLDGGLECTKCRLSTQRHLWGNRKLPTSYPDYQVEVADSVLNPWQEH
eukprot:SM000236S08007  [mRNA]  locus=s236:117732:119396:- [translate_table: standard]